MKNKIKNATFYSILVSQGKKAEKRTLFNSFKENKL